MELSLYHSEEKQNLLYLIGCSTFLNQTTYSTGSNSVPQSVAVVDVNSDNKPDIVVANYGSNNVGVLLNTGNGKFGSQITYSTGSGSSPWSVAVVDVNSDNKPDIVVANSDSNNVGVFLNTGTGTFGSQITYSTGSYPESVAVVDVNSDNKPDIVVANYGSNNVGVLLNTGNGKFGSQTTYSTGSNSGPKSVAVVDVNSDNKPDIVVGNEDSNNVGVFLNTGTGTFGSRTTYSTGSGSESVSVAVVDVNSDNKPDIVVANDGSSNVGVLLNTGTGTFGSQTIYATGSNSYPWSVAVVDVNSDNKPDIVVANDVTNNVGIFLNTGNGTFHSQTTYSTGSGSVPVSVAIVDVNSDNKPDIVVVNQGLNNIGVLLHC